MEAIKYIWGNETLRIILIVLVGLIALVFIVLFISHLIKINKGEYSKFLWFETGSKHHKLIEEKENSVITGKNINTGNNFGKIGDN